MLKRKKEKNKSQLYIIGSLLLLIGISILSFKFYIYYKDAKLEKNILNEFYEEQEVIKENIDDLKENNQVEVKEEIIDTTNYVAVLKIPKINLEKGLVAKDSIDNNVEKNIQILNESSMPDKENGNVILAGHNGNGSTSYFRNIHKLSLDDEVSIYYNGYEYKYKVMNSYKVKKTGQVNIIRNNDKNTLTLITCYGEDKQLIVVCELIERI